jgi:hypothetical protein
VTAGATGADRRVRVRVRVAAAAALYVRVRRAVVASGEPRAGLNVAYSVAGLDEVLLSAREVGRTYAVVQVAHGGGGVLARNAKFGARRTRVKNVPETMD